MRLFLIPECAEPSTVQERPRTKLPEPMSMPACPSPAEAPAGDPSEMTLALPAPAGPPAQEKAALPGPAAREEAGDAQPDPPAPDVHVEELLPSPQPASPPGTASLVGAGSGTGTQSAGTSPPWTLAGSKLSSRSHPSPMPSPEGTVINGDQMALAGAQGCDSHPVPASKSTGAALSTAAVSPPTSPPALAAQQPAVDRPLAELLDTRPGSDWASSTASQTRANTVRAPKRVLRMHTGAEVAEQSKLATSDEVAMAAAHAAAPPSSDNTDVASADADGQFIQPAPRPKGIRQGAVVDVRASHDAVNLGAYYAQLLPSVNRVSAPVVTPPDSGTAQHVVQTRPRAKQPSFESDRGAPFSWHGRSSAGNASVFVPAGALPEMSSEGTGSQAWTPASEDGTAAEPEVDIELMPKRAVGLLSASKDSPLQVFINRYVLPAILSPVGKVMVIALVLIGIVLGAVGASRLREGLDIGTLAPDGHFIKPFDDLDRQLRVFVGPSPVSPAPWLPMTACPPVRHRRCNENTWTCVQVCRRASTSEAWTSPIRRCSAACCRHMPTCCAHPTLSAPAFRLQMCGSPRSRTLW